MAFLDSVLSGLAALQDESQARNLIGNFAQQAGRGVGGAATAGAGLLNRMFDQPATMPTTDFSAAAPMDVGAGGALAPGGFRPFGGVDRGGGGPLPVVRRERPVVEPGFSYADLGNNAAQAYMYDRYLSTLPQGLLGSLQTQMLGGFDAVQGMAGDINQAWDQYQGALTAQRPFAAMEAVARTEADRDRDVAEIEAASRRQAFDRMADVLSSNRLFNDPMGGYGTDQRRQALVRRARPDWRRFRPQGVV